MFKEKLTHILHSLFRKIEEMAIITTSLYEAGITPIAKPDENSTKKEITHQYHP